METNEQQDDGGRKTPDKEIDALRKIMKLLEPFDEIERERLMNYLNSRTRSPIETYRELLKNLENDIAHSHDSTG